MARFLGILFVIGAIVYMSVNAGNFSQPTPTPVVVVATPASFEFHAVDAVRDVAIAGFAANAAIAASADIAQTKQAQAAAASNVATSSIFIVMAAFLFWALTKPKNQELRYVTVEAEEKQTKREDSIPESYEDWYDYTEAGTPIPIRRNKPPTPPNNRN